MMRVVQYTAMNAHTARASVEPVRPRFDCRSLGDRRARPDGLGRQGARSPLGPAPRRRPRVRRPRAVEPRRQLLLLLRLVRLAEPVALKRRSRLHKIVYRSYRRMRIQKSCTRESEKAPIFSISRTPFKHQEGARNASSTAATSRRTRSSREISVRTFSQP